MFCSRFYLRFLPLFASLALVACGGGGGSSDQQSLNSNTQVSTTTHIRGDVIKGVIRDARVSVYGISGGQTTSVIATTMTDANGHYSLSLENLDGPVYLEITPSGTDSTMKCDSADGCGQHIAVTELDLNKNGTIDFGEWFPLPSGFRLSNALTQEQLASGTVQANISTVTHLATQLAMGFPQGINDISIAVAQSQLENLFNIDPIAQSSMVDLTNPDSVAAASAGALRHSLVASAILGLAKENALVEVMDTWVEQLQMNSGQMIIRSNEENLRGNGPTLFDLIANALTTAEYLNLAQQVTSLQNEKSTLSGASENSLTDAQPSPTAGGATAAKVDAFLADLRLWQGSLQLDPDQQSFTQLRDHIGAETGAELAGMLKAISIASQYGAIVSLPNAALGAACDSLNNIFAVIACRTLVANRSLEDICNGSLNLVVGARSLCDILNDLTLPLGNGLVGNFALYDGVATIQGSVEGVELNLTLTATQSHKGAYGYAMTGLATGQSGTMTINSGSISLKFDGAIDIRNLQPPESASASFSITYQQSSADVSFEGSLKGDLDLSSIRETDDSTPGSYAGLDGLPFAITATGTFSSIYGEPYAGALTLNGGDSPQLKLELEVDVPDYSDRALVVLTSTPEMMAQGQLTEAHLSWTGKHYEILYFDAPFHGVRITNQDNVILDLDLSVEDGEQAGNISLDGTTYGSVSPLNGSFLFELSDGSDFVY